MTENKHSLKFFLENFVSFDANNHVCLLNKLQNKYVLGKTDYFEIFVLQKFLFSICSACSWEMQITNDTNLPFLCSHFKFEE